MVNGKFERQIRRTPANIEFDYTFGKLNDSVEKCDNGSLEWVAAATRSNEIARYREEITENEYRERQQKISGLIASFSYNCNCSAIRKAPML